jgi:hypothetical protein
MTSITFVKTRHIYDSYIDFIRLAELSDFPLIYSDEVNISNEGVYIFITMNGDVEEHLKNEVSSGKVRHAHLILWNLERPSGSAGSVGNYAKRHRDLMYDRLFDEVWCSDARLAEETQLRFVVLGSDEGLGSVGNDKQYDFTHMSYEIPRRTNIYKHFSNIGPNCWPPERDDVLRKSRFALNIHQDIHPFQEPLRLALFAAYALPVISETIFDAYPWDSDIAIFSGYDSIVHRLRQALTEDYEPYRAMGLRARQRLCNDFQFGKVVREAVSQSLDSWR